MGAFRVEKLIGQCAELVHKSINEKRPIIVRHHADCDGYVSGVVMERAILSIMHKVHRRESDLYYYFKRLPSLTPFYDYGDAIKDISAFLADSARFERKTPLIIICDNGSSEQDLVSLKKLKIYNASIIVIDHHPNYAENDNYIDIHINPHRHGKQGYSAGMLCAMVAGILQPGQENLKLMAALSAVTDRVKGEHSERLLSHAKELGWGYDKLQIAGRAIEHELHYMGYMERRFLVDDLFFGPNMNANLTLAQAEIEKESAEIARTIDRYRKQKGKIAYIDIPSVRSHGYPSAGRIVGMMCDMAGEPVIGLGIGEDFITIRVHESIDADVNKIISHLREKMPHAQVNGGGHAKAGTIRFVPAAKDEAEDRVMSYLSA